MNKKSYDIIIVGAGIAGLKLANLLNNSDLKVLLVEKKPTIRKLVTSVFITPVEYAKKFGLQKHIVHKCDFGWYGTEIKTLLKLKKREFCALDVGPWAKSLKLKCDVKTKTVIKKLKRRNDGIDLFDEKNNKYFAKVVIDCSGDAQVIGTLLGIEKSKGDFIDYACIFKNAKITNYREMGYFQDANLVNCGGWFHPIGKNKFLIGISEWTEVKYLNKKEHMKRMKLLVKNFEPFNKIVKWENRTQESYKIGPTTTLHSSIAEDNYMAAGDASGGGTPFIGLGFYTANEMATSAYNLILKAFETNDFSKNTFNEHQKWFYETFSRHYKWSNVARYIFLHYTTNKEINLFAKRINALSEDEHYDLLLSYLPPRIIFKLLRGNFIWFHCLINAFRYHILRHIGLDVKRRPMKVNST